MDCLASTGLPPQTRLDLFVVVGPKDRKCLADEVKDTMAESRQKFQALRPQERDRSKRPGAGTPGTVEQCHFCKEEKHQVSWKYRAQTAKKGGACTVTTGGTCYCCDRAIRLLGLATRSFRVLDSKGCVPDVLRVSSSVRAERKTRGQDFCACNVCKTEGYNSIQ